MYIDVFKIARSMIYKLYMKNIKKTSTFLAKARLGFQCMINLKKYFNQFDVSDHDRATEIYKTSSGLSRKTV